MNAYGVYGKTVQRTLFEGDEKKRYIHIYHSISKDADEREHFENALRERTALLMSHQNETVEFGSAYEKYFYLHYDKDGVFLYPEEKTTVTEREISLCGYFVIITSERMTAKEALHLYKSRDVSEKFFASDKSFLGNKSMRSHTTSLLETPTDTDVNMNVFYKDSMFKVFPTNYLAMKYSDDEGDNWSDLNIVSTFKPEESKFLVLGPGIGKQITTGENAGRLIVPLYSKSSAELGFMYSDDHGNSWNYVEADHNTGGATAEAQIVEMPDGSLKTYLRTGSGYIAEVTSIDGGETWSDRVPLTEIATTSYGTQLSVINYSQPIDGKPAIILSAPNATNGRKNGKIWIGLINETGQSGVNKYSVEWKYCYSVDTPQMGYSYSCLTELPDGKVGLLYEKYDSWSRNELHLKNILKYEKFTIDELKVQP